MQKHTVFMPADTAREHPIILLGPITTDQDRYHLHADVEFTDGTVALLRYPSGVMAFFGTEPPKMQVVPKGIYMAKGEAGDFRFLLPEQAEALIVAAEEGVA